MCNTKARATFDALVALSQGATLLEECFT
ncbi:protein of unknown function [Alcaligenes faecalis subsp. faecalis]|nr:protein of unknown function [Alcaligenes faecalis subsp. faecalis]